MGAGTGLSFPVGLFLEGNQPLLKVFLSRIDSRALMACRWVAIGLPMASQVLNVRENKTIDQLVLLSLCFFRPLDGRFFKVAFLSLLDISSRCCACCCVGKLLLQLLVFLSQPLHLSFQAVEKIEHRCV